MLFAKNAILGYYGTIYNRLDPASILEFVKAYVDERMIEAENKSIREHEGHRHKEERKFKENKNGLNRIDSVWKEIEEINNNKK